MIDQNNSKHAKEAGKTEAWYKEFIDHARDLFQCVDSEGRFIYVNQAWLATLNYTPEEMKNITLWDIIHPDSMEHCMTAFEQVLAGKAFGEVEAVFVTKNGTPVMVEGSVSVKLDENGCFEHTYGIFRDVTERKRAENVNRLLFDISNAMVTVHCIDDLYKSIHAALGRVMDVTNFFIAIVDVQKQTLYFPYHVDTEDDDFQPITDFNPLKSLSGLVVSKRRPVLYKKEELEQRAEKGGVWGPVPQIWMGTPLMVADDVIGVIAVQSYTDPDLYSEEDLKILAAVSDQMASAIARKRAEEELVALKNFNESIIQTIQEGIIISDLNGVATFVNPALLKMLGYSREDLIGSHWTYIVPPKYHALVEAADSRRLEGKADRYELIFKHKNGTLLTFHVSGNPYYNHITGEIDGTMAVLTDITERKIAEDALRESEEKHRFLAENMGDIIWTLDLDFKTTFVSSSITKILGYTPEERKHQKLSEVMPPESQIRSMEMLKQELDREELGTHKPERTATIEVEYYHRNGSTVWMENVMRALRDEEGRLVGIYGISRDITERKQAEENLRISEETTSGIIDLAPFSIQLLDPEGYTVRVNKAFVELFGSTPPPDYTILSDPNFDSLGSELNPMLRLAKGERVHFPEFHYNTRLISPQLPDNPLWIRAEGFPLLDDYGNVKNLVLIHENITERKRAEEALRLSEERYRGIFDESVVAIYLFDIKKRFIDTNQAGLDLLGYSREELLQMSIPDVDADSAVVLPAHQELLTGGRLIDYEHRLKRKDGTIITVLNNSRPLTKDGGKAVGMLSTLVDITERKRAEEALSERLAFEKMVATISSNFINLPPDKLDKGIDEALKLIGLFFKADRSYVYEFSDDGKIYSNTHIWCAPGIRAYFEKDQHGPIDHESCWEGELLKGNTVIINDVEAMPPEQEVEKHDFQLEEIKSLVTIPLVWDGKVFGCFGLDHVVGKHQWTGIQAVFLKVVAELITNALARHRNEDIIRRLSFHDQLTGLYNRHFLETEMHRLDTERQLPISIIMADLNGLKLVNDTYGHQAGDEMLKRAAEVLKNACRSEDILSRFGGDEFLLYLPQTPETEARRISERIEEACRKEKVSDVPLSLSAGVAVKTSSEQKLSAVLKAAEDNMYQEKLTESRSGKSAIVNTLLNALAAKSYETEIHTRNMQEAARRIGKKLGLPNSELHRLNLLITLHDIGKISIPEELLNKKESLTGVEWEIMKKHCETGFRIARATDEFAYVAEDILAHHERWDGSGYPQGLKGEAIPLLARITAIADAYEVMSRGRPYKKVMSRSEIVAEFKKCSGTHFDPELVEIFLSLLKEYG